MEINQMTERVLREAGDVDADALATAEEAADWYEDGPVEWDGFWDRLESYGYSVLDLASPAAAKIQRHVREYRR